MKDVEIPTSMQRAMAKEAEAVREKRARIKISPPQADGVWKMFCSQTDGFHCNFKFFAASSGELTQERLN
jgi:hypothetical protein